MSATRWGILAVFFSLVTLAAACANARAGWRAETAKEAGAAFAATGGPLLAAGTLLTGGPALLARRFGGRGPLLATVAGICVLLAVAAHASLVAVALTRDDPADEPRPFELRVIRD